MKKHDPFDLEPVKKKLSPFKLALAQMQDSAESLQIETDDDLTRAVEMAAQAKKVNNRINEMRKAVTGPAFQYKKGVEALCKTFTDPLSRVEASVKRKIGTYHHQQELERRKREARAREAARKAQERIDEEAKAAGVDAPQITIPAEPEQVTPVRTGAGSAHFREDWKFEIEDKSKLPEEFLQPDMSAIRKAVSSGQRVIAGVKIWSEKVPVIRT